MMVFGFKRKSREERLREGLEKAQKQSVKARQIEDELALRRSVRSTGERLSKARSDAFKERFSGVTGAIDKIKGFVPPVRGSRTSTRTRSAPAFSQRSNTAFTLGSSGSSPFNISPSTPMSTGVRNVIYGEKKNRESSKKRSITVRFD
jgi:hypothetical protein